MTAPARPAAAAGSPRAPKLPAVAHGHAPRCHARQRCLILAFAALFFAAIAIPAAWPQFSGDSEDNLVKTVLEMRHGGPWWVPTLCGVPRVRKPPLAAWISAAAVAPRTLQQLSSGDQAIRDAAFARLAWEVRWPSVLASALMLLFVAWLASLLGGPRHALAAVMICATSLLILRFVRSATTDTHLALWVTAANAFFINALVRRRWWSGCLGGGVALGLAIMAKGPVALVFTIAPLAIYALMCRRRIHWLAALAGAVVASIIAIPWFVSAMLNTPGTLEAWKSELTNEGARNISRDPWFAHLSLLPHTLPWMPLFLAGVYLVLQPLFRRRNRPALRSAAQSRQPSGAGTATGSPGRSIPGCRMFLALILVLAPLLILSFSRDRKPRYLLPMAGPIAILAAHAVVRMGRAARQTDAASAIVWTQGGVLAAFVLGLPIAGAFFLKLPDGAPWYSRSLTIIALTIGLTALAAGAIWARNSALRGPDTARHLAPWRFMATGALLMLALNVFFALGWSRSTDGLSEMKPAADAILQHLPAGRVVYYDPHPGAKPVILDLDIYLDRTVPNEDPTLSRARDIAAVVALRLPGAPPPALPGWKTVFDYTEQKHQHHWYVLGPQPDQ